MQTILSFNYIILYCLGIFHSRKVFKQSLLFFIGDKMPEKDELFNSSVKHAGYWNFRGLYKFGYDWLVEDLQLNLSENKYVEKLKGAEKDLDIEWEGWRKYTDYFKCVIKVKFEIRHLKNAEIVIDGKKISTNQGEVKMVVKGTLVRDFDGKFEGTGFRKFMRGVYEKWIIASRLDQFETKLIGDCDKFLEQMKSYLDLSGRHR